jgi:hypothetical protein
LCLWALYDGDWCQNSGGCPNRGKSVPNPVRISADEYYERVTEAYLKLPDAERRALLAEAERDEALKWKNEDPRMLREQIRVADVAFNALTARNNLAEAKLKVAVECLTRFKERTKYIDADVALAALDQIGKEAND